MAASLKLFFNKTVIEGIARDLAQADGSFASKQFTKECSTGLDPLELMARARHIAEALHRHLPADFPQAAQAILRSLPAAPTLERMDVFRYLPHVFYVAKFGIGHFEEAMQVQYRLTQHFAAEFSIRAFIEKYPDQTHDRLRAWAEDPNH